MTKRTPNPRPFKYADTSPYLVNGCKETVTVTQIDYHMNGICGAPFYAILFTSSLYGRMMATLFVKERDDGVAVSDSCRCAVLNMDKLVMSKVGVSFEKNSWRGEHYEAVLLAAVNAWNKFWWAEHDRGVTPCTIDDGSKY